MTTGITEPQVPPMAVEPPPRKNVFARIAGVLFTPAEAFAEIARRPDIVAPMLILVIVGYISTALVVPRFDMASFTGEQAAQMRKQNPNISEADAERFARIGSASAKVFMWLSPLLTLLFYVVLAAVFLLAFRLMGGDGTFNQALSITIYAWIPLTLAGIIMAIVVAARGSFDPNQAATLVKSNPAFLADQKAQPALFSLLSSLDVFTIWTLVLAVFGFSAMSRLSRKTSAVIIFSLWIAFVFVKIGFAALASGGGS